MDKLPQAAPVAVKDLMKQIDLSKWDEERYKELNTYFRVRIQGMVDSDPYIKELIETDKNLQLSDLIDRMSVKDQGLWKEFIELDQIKLHMDMRDHLEGRGTPYNPQTGFGNKLSDSEDDTPLW
ncbi:hypothetical protein [Pontibacter ruber]|uniref:Uncharacterized protein n=1 Tax=Pontibacter ruber TaxID=1343895 RepID=A0ABW5CTM2_9BACT|nr:hypothetical protein [Pontibacter ruber]